VTRTLHPVVTTMAAPMNAPRIWIDMLQLGMTPRVQLVDRPPTATDGADVVETGWTRV
jgi:hypothetical protein